MHLPAALLVALLWVLPAMAQPVTPPAAAPSHADATAQPHHRMTWQQRFAQANLTHDGHLTLDQAKGGDATVARHFAEIDVGSKGYVTEDDIAAWHKLQRATRHPAPSKAEDSLRPRPALHHSALDPQSMSPSGDAAPADQGGALPSAPGKGDGDTAPRGPGA